MSRDVIAQNSSVPAPLREFQEVGKVNDYTGLINCTSAKLRAFEAKHGYAGLKLVVSTVLSDVATGMSFTTSPEMISMAADLIIEEFPDTKISDFRLFGKKVLSGAVGGKLFRWDTRTICETWREYYAQREDVFAEARESRIRQEKQEYAQGMMKSADQMRELYAKMRMDANAQKEREAAMRRWTADTGTKSLEEICEYAGFDYVKLERIARQNCEVAIQGTDIDIEMYLPLHLQSVLLSVRRNPEELFKYQ